MWVCCVLDCAFFVSVCTQWCEYECGSDKMNRQRKKGIERDWANERRKEQAEEKERCMSERCAAVEKIWYTSIVYRFRFFDSLSQYNDDESESNERVSIEKFRRTSEISSTFFSLAQERKNETKKLPKKILPAKKINSFKTFSNFFSFELSLAKHRRCWIFVLALIQWYFDKFITLRLLSFCSRF